MGFTSASSPLRIAALPVSILCNASIIPRCIESLHRSFRAALIGGYSFTFLLQYTARIIPDRQTPAPNKDEQHGRRSPDLKLTETKHGPWLRGLQATFNHRHSGTAHDVRNVPSFSHHDLDWVPARASFLRQHFMLLASCYLTLDILGLGADPRKNAIFFVPSKIPFFSRIRQASMEELAMRVFATLRSGLGVFCSQRAVYSLIALAAVGSGLSEPRYWRPLFGSHSYAYSVRRFWGFVSQISGSRSYANCYLSSVESGIRITARKPVCLLTSSSTKRWSFPKNHFPLSSSASSLCS